MGRTYRLREPAPAKDSLTAPAPNGTASEEVVLNPSAGKRLVSLDAYRGFIMTMLAANGFGIAAFAGLAEDNAVWQSWSYGTFQRLRFHFEHPAWQSIFGWGGVSFWDLIQPAFMFMVGVAMPFSNVRRQAMGSSDLRRTLHAFIRAVVLTLMGVFLYSLRSEHTNWIFTNVLAQIGLGYFFLWVLLDRSLEIQLATFTAILVAYWGFFVMNPPPADFDYSAVAASTEKGEVYLGRFAPWSKNGNAGHFFDVWFLNLLRSPEATPEPGTSDSPAAADSVGADPEVRAPGLLRQWLFSEKQKYTHNPGGYVTLNFVPSIATMLLGLFCGQILLSGRSSGRMIASLLVMGAACFAAGIIAHHTVCPIVKRIWTPSWVLFSGGYVIWMLAVFYLLFDVLPLRRLAFPLVVVGMNSIVMYMMGQLLRPWVATQIVEKHFGGLLTYFSGPAVLDSQSIGAVVMPTLVFAVFWLVAFWMYRNRYFVRI